MLVLQLMTARGWQPSYTRDVAFYANFYDLFPNEMQQIFNGMIRGFPQAYMPRVVCERGEPPDCDEPARSSTWTSTAATAASPRPAGRTRRRSPTRACRCSTAAAACRCRSTRRSTACRSSRSTSTPASRTSCSSASRARATASSRTPTRSRATTTCATPATATASRSSRSRSSRRVGVGEQTSIGFAMVKEARDLDAIARRAAAAARQPSRRTRSTAGRRRSRAGSTSLGYDLPTTPRRHRGRDRAPRLAAWSDLESFFNQIIELERDLGHSAASR